MLSTIVLAGLLIISVIFNFTGCSLNAVGSEKAGGKVVDYIENVLGSEAELIDSEDAGNGLYKLKLKVQGKEFESYVTKDGSLLFPTAYNTEAEENETEPVEQPIEVPKSAKPIVDLYIFSYCPAGSAALDSFAETVGFLEDSADFRVKFFSHMHGEYELQQNMIQECIQKVESDKFWDYAKDFKEKVYSKCASLRSTECDKEKSTELMNEKGIDSDAVFACVDSEGDAIYRQEKVDASKLKLQYSPSFVINGVYLRSIDRSPEGIKAEICNAFESAPDKCAETLTAEASKSSGSC